MFSVHGRNADMVSEYPRYHIHNEGRSPLCHLRFLVPDDFCYVFLYRAFLPFAFFGGFS